MKKNHLTLILVVTIALLLLGIFGDFSYDFYMFIRLVAAISAAIFAYLFYQKKDIAWTWVFTISAIIFQPFIRIHLTKEIWHFLNTILIVLLITGFLKYYKKNSKEPTGKDIKKKFWKSERFWIIIVLIVLIFCSLIVLAIVLESEKLPTLLEYLTGSNLISKEEVVVEEEVYPYDEEVYPEEEVYEEKHIEEEIEFSNIILKVISTEEKKQIIGSPGIPARDNVKIILINLEITNTTSVTESSSSLMMN